MARKKFIRKTILRIIEWTYQPFKKIIPPETYRYAATGGFNVALDIFLYFCFYNFILQKQIIDLGFVSISPYIAAFLIVFPITFTTGFLFAKYITFLSSTIHGRTQLVRYAISVSGSILLNYVLLKLFVEYLHIWPTVSKMIITVIAVIYSYTVQRYFTFKTGEVSILKRNSG